MMSLLCCIIKLNTDNFTLLLNLIVPETFYQLLWPLSGILILIQDPGPCFKNTTHILRTDSMVFCVYEPNAVCWPISPRGCPFS